MVLNVGDKLPQATFKYLDEHGSMKEITTEELCKGKKVVLFAVPGAFTPTCSSQHLPGFIEKADEIRGKGVECIACIAVNDPFVMDAWGKSTAAGNPRGCGKCLLLSDPTADFTKAAGFDQDLAKNGLGVRSRRYSMLVEDQVIRTLNLEDVGPCSFGVSSADNILAALA